jgi:23S rRNA (uracil1939-C5)-methyltransferase
VRVELAERGELPGIVLAINCQGRLRRADSKRVHDLLDGVQPAETRITGIVMWGRGWHREWGDCTRSHALADGDIEVRTAGATFGQVNTKANRLLVETVLSLGEPKPDARVLDLYAGAGNFALPLARRSRSVTAVESSAASVEAGRESAQRLGITNVRFETASVENYLARANQRDAFDLVVVNPPRNGLGEAAASVAALRAPLLLYVSCNPTTLARDLRSIREVGYAVTDVMPFDLFPHTFHVETVCRSRLT